MNQITLGSIVLSKAGRDKGRFFLVVEIVSDVYVKLADGDLRQYEKPKLKKIKHLKVEAIVIEEIARKIENKEVIQDAEIRKVLKAYNA